MNLMDSTQGINKCFVYSLLIVDSLVFSENYYYSQITDSCFVCVCNENYTISFLKDTENSNISIIIPPYKDVNSLYYPVNNNNYCDYNICYDCPASCPSNTCKAFTNITTYENLIPICYINVTTNSTCEDLYHDFNENNSLLSLNNSLKSINPSCQCIQVMKKMNIDQLAYLV